MFPTTPAGQQVVSPRTTFSEREEPTPGAPTQRPLPRWIVIIVFCLFAGLIAETFVTPSTSPIDFLLHPIIPPFNVLLYGSFDLLAREIIVRRRAGLASWVLLGAAYGFINEGVAAGTWYVVHPQGYILIAGIDWAWALSLTIFHAVISVIAPIAFIEMLFPSTRGKSLLRRGGVVGCVVLLYSCAFVAIVALAPEPLALLPYRLTVLVIATLFSLVAFALPTRSPSHQNAQESTPATRRLPGLWRLRIAGFLAMFSFFFLNMLFPAIVAALLHAQPGGIVIAQGIDIIVFLVFGALVILRGWSWSRRDGWSPRQNLALLLGGVTFTTLLLNLTEAAMGEVFSTIPFYALLIALTFVWRRRTQTIPTPA